MFAELFHQSGSIMWVILELDVILLILGIMLHFTLRSRRVFSKYLGWIAIPIIVSSCVSFVRLFLSWHTLDFMVISSPLITSGLLAIPALLVWLAGWILYPAVPASSCEKYTIPFSPSSRGKRLVAFVIDAGILAGIIWGTSVLVSTVHGQVTSLLELFAGFLYLVLPLVYFGMFESQWTQATPGKRLLGLQVSDVTDKPLTFGRAVWRSLLKVWMPVGVLLLFFSQYDRTFHDYLSRTMVRPRTQEISA